MKQLTMTDKEVQALIAPAIRKKLKAAGFVSGTASDDHAGYLFPIDLQLAGAITIQRHDDGTWVFQQEEDLTLMERTAATFAAHYEATQEATQRFEEG
jgi:hypothetical protein